MLTLTDTWQIIAYHVPPATDRCSSGWDYEMDKRVIAAARAAGRIVTALRRESNGDLVMVAKLAAPDMVVPSTVPLRRGNRVRS
jgi:hypothetical protein